MIYSCVLFILLHSYTAYALIIDLMSGKSLIYLGFQKSWMGRIVVSLDHLVQMLMNSVGSLSLLIQHKRFYNFFQNFNHFEQKYYTLKPNLNIVEQNKKIETSVLLYLGVYIIGVTLAVITNEIVSLLRIFSIFCMLSHFIFSQLYEFAIFEKLRLHFISLKKDVGGLSQTKWIELHMELWELSIEGSTFFTFVRIICLFSANALISLMWFYSFGHVIDFLNSFIWQMIIMTTLVMCYAWHRLGKEVGKG